MYKIIQESLSRQEKALILLRELLENEYRILMSRDTNGVAAEEFSIQELIRQLAVEKNLVIKTLSGMRVAEYAATLPEGQAKELERLLGSVDAGEQAASRQASRNAQLSLGLLDQSSRNLHELTSHAMPVRSNVYGRRGALRSVAHPQAALISGRL